MKKVDIVFVRSFRGSRNAEPGDVWRNLEPRTAVAYVQGGYAEPLKTSNLQRAVEPVYIGGGVYQLPDGRRVRGRQAVEAEIND
jgi:hypothetical protein